MVVLLGPRRDDHVDVRIVDGHTSVATNAIIEGKIARSGFVTTDGFRDLLEEELAPVGSIVQLVTDSGQPDRDRYDRLLRYVDHDDVDVDVGPPHRFECTCGPASRLPDRAHAQAPVLLGISGARTP